MLSPVQTISTSIITIVVCHLWTFCSVLINIFITSNTHPENPGSATAYMVASLYPNIHSCYLYGAIT